MNPGAVDGRKTDWRSCRQFTQRRNSIKQRQTAANLPAKLQTVYANETFSAAAQVASLSIGECDLHAQPQKCFVLRNKKLDT